VSISPEVALALARQRRFLILMSLAVAGYAVLGVYPKSEGEYVGFNFRLLRPERVKYGLWLIFLWATLRYIQRLIKLWTETKGDVVEDIDAADRRLALKTARRYSQRLVDKGEISGVPPNARVARGTVTISREVGEIIESAGKQSDATPVPEDFAHSGDDGRIYERLNAVAVWTDDKGAPTGTTFNFVMRWPGCLLHTILYLTFRS
jgi:hypothetical protein